MEDSTVLLVSMGSTGGAIDEVMVRVGSEEILLDESVNEVERGEGALEFSWLDLLRDFVLGLCPFR